MLTLTHLNAALIELIAIVPASKAQPIIDSIVDEFEYKFGDRIIRENFIKFENEYDLNAYVQRPDYATPTARSIAGAIVAKKFNEGPLTEYVIRLNHTSVPDTNMDPVDLNTADVRKNVLSAYSYTFLALQGLMDAIVLKNSGVFSYDTTSPYPLSAIIQRLSVTLRMMPIPEHQTDDFALYIGDNLGLFLTIVFIWTLSRIVTSLVEEKELRIREGMKMMGLKHWVLILSWVITYLVIFFLTALSITVTTSTSVYKYSSSAYIFFFYFLFCTALFSFGYFISVFFDRARIASTAASILFIFLYFLSLSVQTDTTPVSTKQAACLVPSICLSFGASVLSKLESASLGATAATADNKIGNFTINTALGMLFLDTVLYFIIALYLEQVLPSDYGLRRPWYFVFKPSFWFSCCKGNKHSRSNSDTLLLPNRSTPAGAGAGAGGTATTGAAASGPHYGSDSEHPEGKTHHHDSAEHYEQDAGSHIEPVAPNLRGTELVSVRALQKIFPGKDGKPFKAVRGLTLDMYEGQIFALLGHNGAGKTTVMNMLTGLYPPTAGHATVLGNDIATEMDEIRANMGVCPQHDILYPTLTVYEHLSLYAALKGVNVNRESVVMDMIEKVGLGQSGDRKAEAPAGTLSGGQKRKLSVGIALIGGSRIVFLDEPSSGMDVSSQRHIWDMLVQNKAGRVIVLTTHSMEEAELGDRIAIMSHGSLRCNGSSLYLKGVYGVGYTLVISKVSQAPASSSSSSSTSTSTSTAGPSRTLSPTSPAQPSATIIAFMKEHAPFAQVISDAAGEISYRCPFAESHNFPSLFDALDQNKAKLGIATYGVSVTTLTEVFLKVGDEGAAFLDENVATAESLVRSGTTSKLGHNNPFHQDSAAASASAAAAGVASVPTVAATDGSYMPPSNSSLAGKKTSSLGFGKSKSSTTVASSDIPLEYKDQSPTIGPLSKRPSGSLQAEDLDLAVTSAGAGTGTWKSSDEEEEEEDHWQTGGAEKRLSGFALFWRHTRALYIKRWHAAKRDKRQWLWQVFIPGFLLFFSLLFIRLAARGSYAPRELNARGLYALKGPMVYPIANETGSAVTDTFARYLSNTNNGAADLGLAPTIWNPTTVPSAETEYPKYLLATALQQTSGRFMAMNLKKASNLNIPSEPAPTGLSEVKADLYCNYTAADSVPTNINLLTNVLLRAKAGPGVAGADVPHVRVVNHPFDLTQAQKVYVTATVAFAIALSLSFIPGTFASFIVKEREDKGKHLQTISGVSQAAYWASSYLWDLTNFTVPFALSISFLLAFDVSDLVGETIFMTILLYWMFAISVTPFAYCFSFLFTSHTLVQHMLLLVNFVGSVALLIVSIVMDILSSTKELNKSLKYIYRLFPPFCMGDAVARLAIRNSNSAGLAGKSVWDLDVAGSGLLFLAIDTVIYVSLLIALEHYSSTSACFCFAKKLMTDVEDDPALAGPEDDDVAAERMRIQADQTTEDDAIVMKGLRKVYAGRMGTKPHVAVADLYYSVRRGECFGFLGANGAGKTSAIKILTGDIYPTKGTATLNGFDIVNQPYEVRQLIGYCPQFDALQEFLTAREHLELYARIKCVPEDKLKAFVDYMLDKLSLSGIADKPAGTYSGGNKRKLSVGIALIGSPPIVFLDEPSTGMDPQARRFMWQLISTTMANRSVILTTHSMEECEALCNRIGIMTNGRLQCLGTSQHLKSKFGKGYQVAVKATIGSEAAVKAFVLAQFPSSTVIEEHAQNLRFRVPRDAKAPSISVVFRAFEANKQQSGVAAYSVSETDLEQLFIQFVKEGEARRENYERTHGLAPMVPSASVGIVANIP